MPWWPKSYPRPDPVHKVTIIPRGRALGVTMQLPTEDRYSQDRTRLLSTITVLFGGRIAERIVHEPDDHRRFQRLPARHRPGPAAWSRNGACRMRWDRWSTAEEEGEVFLGRSVTTHKSVSEETLRRVDAEVRRIIDEQYAIARKILEENRDKVEAMTAALLQWETIDAEQIDDIMAGHAPRPPKPVTPPAAANTGGSGRAPRRPAPRRRAHGGVD